MPRERKLRSGLRLRLVLSSKRYSGFFVVERRRGQRRRRLIQVPPGWVFQLRNLPESVQQMLGLPSMTVCESHFAPNEKVSYLVAEGREIPFGARASEMLHKDIDMEVIARVIGRSSGIKPVLGWS